MTIRIRIMQSGLLMGLLSLHSGCVSSWFTPPASQVEHDRRESLREVLKSEDRPTIVSQIATSRDFTVSSLENIALVTNLVGTGGLVKPSQPRDKLIAVMRRNEVANPNALLDADVTTMVTAVSAVPPAAQKGDVLDVAVDISTHAEASDLQHGWLMETSLVEMSRLGGQLKEGFEMAVAEGPIVTMAQVNGSSDPQAKLAGIVIGGTKLLKPRTIGIGIDEEYADAVTVAAVLPAIKKRFTYFDGLGQKGVATPRSDSYIELVVPPKYATDPFHFVNVVLQIGFNESASQYAERLQLLQQQIFDPAACRNACWQLEAIGDDARDILASGLTSPDAEVRFYTAHSLAYLNDRRSIETLKQLARAEPAFRAMCLTGLSIVDDYSATEALEELLNSAESEVRYGAFLALRHRDRSSPLVTGTRIGEAGSVLEIPTSGPPLIAVSLSKKPEIVVFGSNPQITLPTFLYLSDNLIVRGEGNGNISVSQFAKGQEDKVREVPADLRSVLAAISEVGGNYGEWVTFLRLCGEKGYVIEPVAMNPVPVAGRIYHRQSEGVSQPGSTLESASLIDAFEKDRGAMQESMVGQEESVLQTAHWYNPLSWWK
ncbi:MAG: flagellar basal body P-ring protein FlgI [Planctomycetales bacterium]|nr:flagellar basal body P-ring protein FlgI [Planctomycetales bacterium]